MHLSGMLNEKAVLPRLDHDKMLLDLEGLTGINSSGVMRWLKWLNEHRFKTLTLVKCPEPAVHMFSLVAGALPTNLAVDSFYVPFLHEPSGDRRNILFRIGRDFDEQGRLLVPLKRAIDGKEYQIDSSPDQYFNFIRRKK